MERIKRILRKTGLIKIIRFFYHLFIPLGGIRNYIIFPIKAFLRIKKISFFYKDYKEIETY